ncbi:SRPBCC domain-containing protein [Nocardioides alcanivorans]|uniref:SRPBCC domain-containing protein n=1 Tax=Nocardioides alcanivorans TaxID=2897352 RepID=UPI001F24B8F2|nr:SRPBCC domain-containing protein [Nocardioides alcanivorans]
MAIVINHDLEIEAPAATVWQVLTDFDAYGTWNPFARKARCDLRPGGTIDMQVVLVGQRPMRQREFINSVDPGRGFSYSMKPAPGGLLRSRRDQEVVDLGDGRSRYTSRFRIEGPLAPVVSILLGRALRRGFDGNVAGLKERAESL